MSNWKRGVLAILLPLTVMAWFFGCYGGEPVLTDHSGYPVYKKYCRRCHGNRGDGGKASRMAERPVDVLSPAYRDTVDVEAVRELIRVGKGKMKGYEAKLTVEEVEAVARYVLEMPTRDSLP